MKYNLNNKQEFEYLSEKLNDAFIDQSNIKKENDNLIIGIKREDKDAIPVVRNYLIIKTAQQPLIRSGLHLLNIEKHEMIQPIRATIYSSGLFKLKGKVLTISFDEINAIRVTFKDKAIAILKDIEQLQELGGTTFSFIWSKS